MTCACVYVCVGGSGGWVGERVYMYGGLAGLQVWLAASRMSFLLWGGGAEFVGSNNYLLSGAVCTAQCFCVEWNRYSVEVFIYPNGRDLVYLGTDASMTEGNQLIRQHNVSVHACVYIYICMYLHVSTYINVHRHMYIRICVYACFHVCVCMHACMYICMHLCVNVYRHVFMYVSMYIM